MTGLVLQINVSRGGLPKRAIPEGQLTSAGFTGDSWAHPKIHGGPDKAVLAISAEVVATLKSEGFPVYPGALGENLTVEGLAPADWRSGQIYRVGEATIELTTIRVPCAALKVYGPEIGKRLYNRAVAQGDTTSPLWAKGGFYARVLQPGPVFPGNPIRLMSALA